MSAADPSQVVNNKPIKQRKVSKSNGKVVNDKQKNQTDQNDLSKTNSLIRNDPKPKRGKNKKSDDKNEEEKKVENPN